MLKKLYSDKAIITMVVIGVIIPLWPIIKLFCEGELNWNAPISISDISSFGSFVAGTTGILWGLASVLLIYKTFHQSQIQQFESTYFEMLTTMREIINSTEDEVQLVLYFDHNDGIENATEQKSPTKGTTFFSAILKQLKNSLSNPNNIQHYLNQNLGLIHLKATDKETEFLPGFKAYRDIATKEYALYGYSKVFSEQQSQLGHLFRYIFNIIKFVDKSSLFYSDDEKERYINLIQAQLSNDLLGLLFYNAQTEKGKKFIKYIERFNMLENLAPESVIDVSHGKMFYPNLKFKYLS